MVFVAPRSLISVSFVLCLSPPCARAPSLPPSLAPSLPPSLPLPLAVDVEGSSVDHQTSTSNPCLTQRSLLQRAFMEQQPAALSSFGQHRFLLLNGYRTGVQEFAAVGLYLRVMRHFTGNEGVSRGGRHSEDDGAPGREGPGDVRRGGGSTRP